MGLVNALPDESYFSIIKIAQENGGHEILKTPPYRCELQPIEKIWAVMKNIIASKATVTMTSILLKGRPLSLFCQSPCKVFYSVWKNLVRIGMRYYKERSWVQEEIAEEVYQEVFDEEEPIVDLNDTFKVDISKWDAELLRVVNQEQAEAVILGP
ncbi:hypothetical protein BX616_008064 [Lobosporangium transversale]|nr:hypothetical protein BX616_008064 [Lobosporangium transversale]